MALFGDIRYMLTQSHYRRTTVCVCVSAQARTVRYGVPDLLRETNVGGMVLFPERFLSIFFIF